MIGRLLVEYGMNKAQQNVEGKPFGDLGMLGLFDAKRHGRSLVRQPRDPLESLDE